MRKESSPVRALRFLTAALFAMVAFGGCSAADRIIYKDREPFNPPLDAVTGFLGYYNASAKQTTCGNCHASFQAKWKGTKHAGAFESVASNPNVATACAGCHTVNGNGNKTKGLIAGYAAVKDSVYYDVQCESCHGPGLQHVEGVGQANLIRPLARISMSDSGNCGDCHSGSHNPFAEEWAASGHAKVSASRAASPDCKGCHDGRGALARWGVDENYAERDSATAYQPTVCAVCHAPHGSDNPAQLRFPVTSQDPEQNLCIRCHMRRTEPSQGSPHAPQGAVLLGFAGYRPPGFVYDTARIFGSHATTANPNLCAGCHVGRFTVTDALTGNFSFQATGHLMRPIPCLDTLGTGIPTGDKTCAYTATARSWKTCSAAGCHANATVAAGAFATVRARMKFLADQLWTNLDGDGSIDPTPIDAGLLATLKQTMPAEWNSSDGMVTPAEGAEFNAKMCGEYNSSTSDNSKGIHNPFLCEALLIASIDYVKSYYSLLTAANVTAQASLTEPMIGGKFSGSMHLSRTPPGR